MDTIADSQLEMLNTEPDPLKVLDDCNGCACMTAELSTRFSLPCVI